MNGEVVAELVEQLTGGPERHGGLRTLIDVLPDAIVVVDHAGRVVFAGSAIERLSGYPPDDLVGRRIEVLVPADRHPAHLAHREAFAHAPASRPMGGAQDIALAHRDGHEVAVDVSLSPIESGGQRFVVAAVRDAQERQVAERSVQRALAHERQAADQLREVAEAKNAFIRAVSHDLRTPLTVVQGLAQTLEARAADLPPDKVQALAGRLALNAERLSGLLTDLLDVDRLTRGTIRAERRRTDVVELVRQAVERSCPASRPVLVDTPERLEVDIDPAQVERILENLLTNAVKHTPAGGPIAVHAELDPATEAVLLIVDDEGHGVPVEHREAIFEPFAQLDGASHAPGSGIGLSLVAEFARLHGGRAWVEERPGGGASFRVLLPLRHRAAAVSDSQAPTGD